MTTEPNTKDQDTRAFPQDGAAPPPGDSRDAGEAFGDAMARLSEIQAYVGYYIGAKVDSLKLSLRKAIIAAVLGIIGLVAAMAAVVVAVVMLLNGIAAGLGAALGGRVWLGDLIVGVGFFALLGLGVFVGLRSVTAASRKKTVEKYESRKSAQHSRFGHGVN